MDIKQAHQKDLFEIARLNRECFPYDNTDDRAARHWIEANFNCAPRMQYFVAENDLGNIVGYILWMEKGGFRTKSVWELEQIGVDPKWRNKGIGTRLIQNSFWTLKEKLANQGRQIKLVLVTTGTSNEAQKLYKKALGAKPECIIGDLFDGDELVMISRGRG